MDALAVYKGLDVGTAKPLPAPGRPPVHLVDLAEPGEDFSVARFQAACGEVVSDLHSRGVRVVFAGGTGLYHRAVLDGLSLPGRYPDVAARLEEEAGSPGGLEHLHARLAELDPLAASRITPGNRRRVVRALEVTLGSGRPFSSYGPGLEAYPPVAATLVGLKLPRAELDRRLADRLQRQMAEGLIEEVRDLFQSGGELSRTAAQAIGYRELIGHLRGEMSLDDALGATLRRLRAFARRQEAWFRRDPRIVWFDASSPSLVDEVLALLDEAGGRVRPCETRTS